MTLLMWDASPCKHGLENISVADPGGVQGVRTPPRLTRRLTAFGDLMPIKSPKKIIVSSVYVKSGDLMPIKGLKENKCPRIGHQFNHRY